MRGQGTRLWDDAGREYLDCMSSRGAAILGHAHPAIVEALSRQAAELVSAPGAFHHPQKTRLMKRLVELAPRGLARVFLCNSGTESIEAALKLARASTGRSKIVAAKRGFHGRSFGAMSATFSPKQHALFAPVVPDVDFIAYNKTESLDEALDDNVAAFVLDLVQGEGGVHGHDFVARAATLCREHGILLVIDEVQTGFGRTGRLFACEHYGHDGHDVLTPDILCLAKGIAAGFPMGAIVVRDGLEFAAGHARLDVRWQSARVRGREHGARHRDRRRVSSGGGSERRLLEKQALRGSPRPRSHGRIELGERARPYVDRLAERGVLALTAGKKVLRLLPPLIITRDEIERAAGAVRTSSA